MVLKMENQEVICRFCFKNCDGNLKPIEGSLEEMLNTLLLNMNPAPIEASFICTSCEDILNRCFEFKSMCLFMQTNIVSNIDIDNAKANPKGVANPENLNTCSLCMAVLQSCSFISLDNADDDMLNQVFERCIPELDLSVTMKPAICKACYEHLQIYFNVMRNCSILEKTAMVDKGLMVPPDVLKHTSSRDVCKENENNIEVIKIEETFCEKENEFDYMDMEDTKNIDVLKFTYENMLTGNDGIEVNGIKTEGIFCEKLGNETRTKLDGKGVTVPQDMLHCTSREIFDANEINRKGTYCKETETEFDHGNYTEMEDTKCIDLLQFPSTNVTCDSGSAAIKVKTEGIVCEQLEIEEVKPEFVFIDQKLNNLQHSSSEHALKCEDEGNGNFTETDDENFLPYNNEKIEIVSTDERNFDRFENELPQPDISSRLHRDNKFGMPDFEGNLSKPYTEETLTEMSESKIKMFKCNSCIYQTKYRSAILTHLLKHKIPSEVAKYKCDSCSYQTKDKSNLKKHLLKHKDPLEETTYKCDSCLYQTKYKTSLKIHLLKHKDPLEVTMYKCASCLYQTKHKANLKLHLLKHTDLSEVTMYKCDTCSYQTKYKTSLKIHLLKHKDPSEVTMYKCESCSYETKRICDLKAHLLKHKDPSEVTMHSCKFCLYNTKLKSRLNQHLLKHKDPSEVTMYNCNLCSYNTKRKSTLNQHLLKHKDPSEVTMYKCDFCLYQTKRKGNLKKHLLQHEGLSEVTSDRSSCLVIMYKCDSCLYETKHKSNLKAHFLKHRNPLEAIMYKCDSCSYQTKDKNCLKKHLLKHKDPSEVTMYKCDSCLYQTKYRSNLKLHLLKHRDVSEVTM